MKCPVCIIDMTSTYLETDLPAHNCETCAGVWVASTHYWVWLEQHQRTAPDKPAEETPLLPVSDMKKAGFCPWCGYLLIKYRVGHDINFTLDQCGNCNSFWFDKHEWEVLKSRNLHNQVHKVFTPAWQKQIRQEQSKHTWQEIYKEKFGAEDYAEIQRVRAWIYQHPERHRLLAYLTNENPYSFE